MKLAGLSCVSVIAIAALLGPWNSASATESSTRHKHHVHHRVHARAYSEHSAEAARHGYYRSLEPYRSMDFRGEFPGNCAVERAAGECMIDLGYGRCESCSVGGPP